VTDGNEAGNASGQGHVQKPLSGASQRSNNRKRRRPNVLIRPIHVPQAPQNSTQFIIDDLEQRHSPTFSGSDVNEHQDFDMDDNSDKFYKEDFEMAFNGARFDELMIMDRNILVDRYQKMETSVALLQKQLLYINPGQVLHELKNQVDHLREENKLLKRRNHSLQAAFDPKSRSDDTSSGDTDDEPDSSTIVPSTSGQVSDKASARQRAADSQEDSITSSTSVTQNEASSSKASSPCTNLILPKQQTPLICIS
jgi:hypothetical protein